MKYEPGDRLILADVEPQRGTVVMGIRLDVWQRSFRDGQWRSTDWGYAKDWADLLEMNMGTVRVVWVYGG